jgi:hypothetical protein
LSSSYGRIGHIYSIMGEYSKALPYCERVVDIEQYSLPSNHPNLLDSRKKLDRVKQEIVKNVLASVEETIK